MAERRAFCVSLRKPQHPWTGRAGIRRRTRRGALVPARYAEDLERDLTSNGIPPFFSCRATEDGREFYWQDREEDLGGLICGVVVVEAPGVPYHGLTSLATREHRFWWEMLRRGGGHFFFLRVLERVELVEPLCGASSSGLPEGGVLRTRGWVELGEAFAHLLRGAQARGPSGNTVTVGQWLQDVGAELVPLDIGLPDPLLRLLQLGVWQTVGLALRGFQPADRAASRSKVRAIHVLCEGTSFPEGSQGRARERDSEADDAEEETAGAAGGLAKEMSLCEGSEYCADCVREWHRQLRARAPVGPESADELDVCVESVLVWLRKVEAMFDHRVEDVGLVSLSKRLRVDRRAYDAVYLLRAWELSGLARSDRNLQEVIVR